MNNLLGKEEKFFPAREIKTPDFSTFVSFDIETTGLGRNSHIIEIGAAKVINGEIVETYDRLVDPGILIPPEITDLTGIDDDMVNNAPRIEDALSEFSSFAGNNILVGHNALSFDCKIMGYWADEYGIYIGNDVFDTLRYVRYRCEPFPMMESRCLSYLCDYFDISSDTFHRATADAVATAKLYFHLRQKGVPKQKNNK